MDDRRTRAVSVTTRLASVIWGELRRPQMEEAVAARAVVLVPVGAVEQHGPHLPLDTDSNIVTALAVRVAEGLRDQLPVLVAPTIAIGMSAHHMAFAGTISLRLETMAALLKDVCRSIHAHGFRKIVLLNGHGGNTAIVTAVAGSLVEERIAVASLTYWAPITGQLKKLARGELGSMSHACEMETSLQLALRPQLVDQTAAVVAPVRPLTSFFFKDFRSPGSVSYTLNFAEDATEGVRGDPSIASAETGEAILTAAQNEISRFMLEFAALPDR